MHVIVGGKSHATHSGMVGRPGYERVMAPNRIHRTVVAVLLTRADGVGLRRRPARTRRAGSRRRPRRAAQPVAPPGSGPRYVAMGDSAAAAPLVPEQAQPVGCLKSTNDYPSVLARRIGAASFTDVTCSGARTEDLVSRSQPTRTGPVPPQLDAVTADTQLVTVTIGGNDVDLPTIAGEVPADQPGRAAVLAGPRGRRRRRHLRAIDGRRRRLVRPRRRRSARRRPPPG